MTADNFNRWLTLGANLGVLLGIILLIVEIDQNSELVRVQIEQARSESYVTWLRETADGDHVSPLIAKLEGLDDPFIEQFEKLDPVERVRYQSMVEARYYDYENLFSQYQDGFFSDSYWEERIVPAVKEWAPRWNETIPPDGPGGRQAFKAEVRRILQESQ